MGRGRVWKNRIAWLLLALLVSAGTSARTAFAKEALGAVSEFSDGVMKLRGEGLEAVLHYGAKGSARYGRECLVRGTVTSKEGSFSGSMEFVLTDTEGRQQCYEYPVEEAAGGSFLAALPMHRYLESVEARLKGADGKVLARREVPLKRLFLGTGSAIGVLSGAPEAEYRYLSSFGCYVLYLQPEEIAECKEGLNFFDILLLDGYQAGSLRDGQLAAIKEWVQGGGTLCIGTGADGEAALLALEEAGLFSGEIKGTAELQTCYGMNQAVQKSLNSKILEYEIRRRNLQDFVSDYENWDDGTKEAKWGRNYIGDTMEGFYKGEEASILYATETVRLCCFVPEQGIVAAEENGEPILFTERYGEGCLEWFTVSLGRKLSDYYGIYFVFLMQQNQSAIGAERLSNLSYYTDSSYVRYAILDEMGEYRVPETLKYAILLFGYVLLIGPGLFFLLKKKGKSLWSFAATPVLAVLSLLLLYALGSGTRVTKPYVKYVERIEQDGEEAIAKVTALFAAPTGREWAVRLSAKPSVRLYPNDVRSFYDMGYFYDDGGQASETVARAVQSEQETVLAFSKVPPFTEMEAELEYPVAAREIVEEHITLSETGMDGNLTNVSANAFEKAYLYCEGVFVSMGELGPGETAELKEKEQTVLLSQQAMNELYVQTMEYGEEAEEVLVKSYLYQEFPKKRYGSWFIGITKEASEENPLTAETQDYEVAAKLTMYCLKLPVGQGEEEFCLLTDETMQVLEGDYSVNDMYRYLISDVLVAEYRIPAGNITEIVFPTFYNQNYHSYLVSGWDGSISLYNFETEAYEAFVSGFEEKSTKHPAPYLSADGAVRVRYEKNPLYAGYSMQLPYLAYYLKKEEHRKKEEQGVD